MKKIAEEKGSITLFVLVAILFFIMLLLGMYSLSKNKESAQTEEISRIKEIYEKDVNIVDDIYETITNRSLKPGEISLETEKNNYVDTDGNVATIPAGFTISGIPGEQMIDDGLVIYDIPEGRTVENWNEDKDKNGIKDVQENYDQFVWVPETNYDTREETGYESTYTGEGTEESESIKKYGGYYIGRYETGKEKEKAVIRRGKEAYTGVTIADAVAKSKTFYTAGTREVKTNLVKGKQWNGIMTFVGDEVNTRTDSSLWGNYANYEYEKNGEKFPEFDGNWDDASFLKNTEKVFYDVIEIGTVTTTINKTSVNSVDKLHLNIKFKNDSERNWYASFAIYCFAAVDDEEMGAMKVNGLTTKIDTSKLDSSLFRIDEEHTTSERIILYTNNFVESGTEIEFNDIGFEIFANLEDIKNANLYIQINGSFLDEHNMDAANVPQVNSIRVVKLDMRDDYIVDNLLENKNYQIKKTYITPSSSAEHKIPIIKNPQKPTGYSEEWKAKNIYDLAGNVEEWTMEKETATNNYVTRGGKCYNFGNLNYAGSRKTTTEASDTLGYRIAMYIQ